MNQKKVKSKLAPKCVFMLKAAVIMTTLETPRGSIVCKELAIKQPNIFLYTTTSGTQAKQVNLRATSLLAVNNTLPYQST